MYRKTSAIAILFLLMGLSLVYGQRSAATDRDAMLVSGMVSFSTQGGDLYEQDDDRFTTLTITPGLLYFIAPGIGLGIDYSYTRISERGTTSSSWGAGPKMGIFFDSGASFIPFVSGGVNYLSIDPGDVSESGLRMKVSGGMLIRNGHLAVSVEAGFVYDRFKFEGASSATTGNTILIGVGFAGFLYQ